MNWNKGEYIRFGKITYKVKYISILTEEQKVYKRKGRKQGKIVPLNVMKEEKQLNTEEEESKMLQESNANNSAIAATIDYDYKSSNNRRNVFFQKYSIFIQFFVLI